jgi:hypothetical protein
LRRIRGINQESVAKELGIKRDSVSAMETADDNHLSTVKRYVEALGGQLELWVVLGGERVLVSAGVVNPPGGVGLKELRRRQREGGEAPPKPAPYMDPRRDNLLAVLARYVQALGGQLEALAVFPDARYRLAVQPGLPEQPRTRSSSILARAPDEVVSLDQLRNRLGISEDSAARSYGGPRPLHAIRRAERGDLRTIDEIFHYLRALRAELEIHVVHAGERLLIGYRIGTHGAVSPGNPLSVLRERTGKTLKEVNEAIRASVAGISETGLRTGRPTVTRHTLARHVGAFQAELQWVAVVDERRIQFTFPN